LLDHCELQEHAPDLLASPLVGEAQEGQAVVSTINQNWNPSAGINTSSIYRVNTSAAQRRVSADCQEIT
jgi:hypothetical protein